MAGPLSGVRVIEMSTWAALPGGGAILADWGAEVIKVEEPEGGGDPAREFNKVPKADGTSPIAPTWEQDNRNKKAITINVNKREGQEALHRLIKKADVFVTSTRPSTLKKLHISYDELSKINPRLIFLHLSGYGPKGPDAERPGYDALCFWARNGIGLALAKPDGSPTSQRAAMGDHTTSVTIAGGIAAALYAREKTGKGQHVQASLFHAGLWVMSADSVVASYSGRDATPMNRGVVGNPLVGTYQCKDGWLQMVNLQSDRFWQPFCEALGRQDMAKDERYSTSANRAPHAGALMAEFQKEFLKKKVEEWIPILDKHGIRWGRVQTVLGATKDPQAWANGYFKTIEHPEAGTLNLVTSPIQFSETPTEIKSIAPLWPHPSPAPTPSRGTLSRKGRGKIVPPPQILRRSASG
ncbi:MAG: CoA transferase [Chloroflexi bacterium]|nr:CoA transferase [Chloroflexota bacterium]